MSKKSCPILARIGQNQEVKKMKACLDLCSGRGGFSQAFKENKEWKVVTVDINPKFKPSMVLDLTDVVENKERYESFWNLKPDIILASPPCERWSIQLNKEELKK